MAVTPEDVRNKQFTTSRFKEGYDLDEVDDFLDEIEESLSALTKEVADLRATAKGEIPSSIREEIATLTSENNRLKNELDQAINSVETLRAENESLVSAGGDDSALEELRAKLTQSQNELNEAKAQLANTSRGQEDLSGEIAKLNAAVEELTAANANLAKENEELKQAVPVMDAGEASSASVRILELAQRTADEAVATARIESENLRNTAQTEVERLMRETNANIQLMTREFETQKANMERKVEELRAYEREYRSRLRSYLEGQLRELEGKSLGGDRQVEG